MHALTPLQDFVANFLIIVVASVAVLLLSQRLRLSPVIGFLATGMLIGPSGLRLIERHQVELFAEIGIVILLFTVGLEFSLANLRRSWRPFLIGGGLQVGGTVLVTAIIAVAFGVGIRAGVFLGFLAALSSTAIVLKAYSDRNELVTPQGVLVASVLLFQDVCLAPMIVLTPVLGGLAAASPGGVLLRLGVGVLLVALTFMAARLVMPKVLHWIVRTRVRETFLLGALGACLGMGMLTSGLGFSMPLGAFLAGLILSESEYGHEVSAEVLPFRDLFNSLFFVSLGMLLRFEVVGDHWATILAVGAGILVVKTLVVVAVVLFMMYPLRTALIAGLSLAQAGEFSFVLAGVGLQLGLMHEALYQSFLGAAIFTMLLAPVAVAMAPRLATVLSDWLGRGRLPAAVQRLRHDLRGIDLEPPRPRAGHVIVVGFGLNGRNLSRVLRETAIPFVVLELDGDQVRLARDEGVPVLYGDATRADILERCGLQTANVLVLAISDLEATRQAVRVARRSNPGIHILARTRSVNEIDSLRRLGADEVIPEEFETSIEIFSRVLELYHVPRNIVDVQVRILRDEGYGILRGATLSDQRVMDRVSEILQGTLTETFLVRANAPADGRTLRELELRRRSGASVIALVRDGQPLTNPEPDLPLQAGDTLVLVGGHAALETAFDLLEGRSPAAPKGELA